MELHMFNSRKTREKLTPKKKQNKKKTNLNFMMSELE